MRQKKLNKVTVFGEYVGIPFYYGNNVSTVLFIPRKLIETGDFSDIQVSSENFFGVDMKQVLKVIDSTGE